MRTLSIALFVLIGLSALPAFGQNAALNGNNNNNGMVTPSVSSAGSVTATPEMWFYEQQLREYLSPKLAVRRKAEFKSQQRNQRIAAMRWFGFSNIRPTASPDPFNGDYSPCWTGADVLHPFRWSGCGYAADVYYER